MLISAANFSETTTEITKFGIGASKIFSLTFKKDGAVIADFVPAKRVSDGIVGMYETVDKKFYTGEDGSNFEGKNFDYVQVHRKIEAKNKVLAAEILATKTAAIRTNFAAESVSQILAK